MSLVYFFVVFLVTSLLMAIPLLPFCKVWMRLKTHHPDIWHGKGPFDFRSMLSHGILVTDFLDIAKTSHTDADISARDPVLARWSMYCKQISEMAPKNFMMQIVYLVVFLYFVGFFCKLIFGIIG